jgi:hypothetical protein
MLALFFVFMVLGMPIAYCMALAAILTVLIDGQLPVLILAQQFYDSLDSFSLLAVPLFILAGELMSVAGIERGGEERAPADPLQGAEDDQLDHAAAQQRQVAELAREA